jgi:hypothetical protein
MAKRKKKAAKKPKRTARVTKRRAKPRKVRKAPKKRAVKRAKRKAPKRRKRVGRRIVKQIEKRSTERVIAKRRRRRRPAKRRVVMAGTRRRRSVGKSGNKGLLIGLAVGAAALYFLTRPRTTTPGGAYQLPPIAQTNNQTRNAQSNNIINYAIAGGLAIDAIIKLIDRLNTSSDNEVENIYDHVNTTGDVGVLV